MNDSKLRLQIITALDNAGLKATQDQINKLEKQLKNVNAKSDVSELNKELTKIPGRFGEISQHLGGVAEKLGTVYVVWKTFTGAIKIGNKLFEMFSNGAGFSLESIKNGFSTLRTTAKNFFQELFTGTSDAKVAAAAHEVAMSNIDTQVQNSTKAADKQIESLKEVREEHQKNIDKIKQETSTYINQAQAVAGLKAAGNNANVVLWESEKAEMMQKYTDEGDIEAAQQVGKAYDLMIAKEKALGVAKQNTYNLNKASRSIEGKASELEAQMRMTDDFAQQYAEAKANYEKAKETKGIVGTKTALQWKRVMKQAQSDYESSLAKEQPLNDQIIADYNSFNALKINAASAYETAFRDVRAKYNSYFESGYGVVDIQFGESMKNIEQESIASYQALVQIAKNTDEMTNLANILKELLTVK